MTNRVLNIISRACVIARTASESFRIALRTNTGCCKRVINGFISSTNRTKLDINIVHAAIVYFIVFHGRTWVSVLDKLYREV